MPAVPPASARRSLLLPALVVLAPILAFYAILFRQVIAIPLPDDYHALLHFVNAFTTLPDAHGKLLFFLTERHGEYRLYFEHAVLMLQYELLHRISLPVLASIGNLTVLLLGLLLWKLFLPAEPDRHRRLLLFLPIPFLLFQLHYFENLDYAMNALQNIPIVPFLVATLYFLHRPGRRSFALSLGLLLLSIGTSGNGLFMALIGAGLLLLYRRLRELAVWTGISVAGMLVYFFRYPWGQLLHHPVAVHHSLAVQLLVRKPVFFFAFLGGAAGHPFKPLAVLLGLVLCGFFAWLCRQGYPRRNPLVAAIIFTVLFSALGVSYTRTEYGVFGSLSSRYGIYSDLLLALCWVIAAELWLAHDAPRRANPDPQPVLRSPLFRAALTLSILFCLGMDAWGTHALILRDRYARQGMNLYLQTGSPGGPIGYPPGIDDSIEQSNNTYARPELARSVALGTYRLPQP